MKTIEQKAKAYDNIIEKANKMHGENCEACQMCIEELIPELKDSEDERIRKDIISYIKSITTVSSISPDQIKECKAWIAWLEKQGKKTCEMKTPEESLGVDSDTYNKIVDECIYGKHNPVDNVEPKFKVGDWVMLDEPVLITKVEDMPYNTHQYWTSDGTWFGDATKVKLWNIEDAKDGDVLAEDSCIFIIEKMNLNGTAIVHCCLFNDGEFDLTGSTLSFDIDSTHPATKEQRNLLFTKMKEAGYEWNTEKKELKKIDNNKVIIKKSEKTTNWKPSYEQMNALCWIANQNKDDMISKKLMTLYNELKKLMEE